MATTTYDPVSVEIHRKALENITTEMAIALTRTSGSPVVYEVQDFVTCLMDRAGEHLSMSSTLIFHAGSSLVGTQAVIAAAEREGDLSPGDGWVVNDPFESGAMHQGDVAIIMPQFYAGDHVGWAFSNVHVADIGGMGISGFAPGAVSVFDEGLRFVPTKIVKDGMLDPSWVEHFKSNVRVADLVLNDLRGMIAANNVAQMKLTEVIDRFGLARFVEYCEINKQLTEDAFRERIEKLPDGVYEAVDWIEFDGHGEDNLYEVRVTLEVADSDLRFSFRGDEQANAFVNGTKGVVYGCLMTTILTALAYGDLPFNAGMWRPLTIDIGPPGTVVNAVPPAALSAGHSIAGLRVIRSVRDVLNQACGLSQDPVLRGRVAGIAADGTGLYPLTGKGHGGVPTVVFFMDNATGNGGGAQSIGDGQDCYGATCMPGVGLNSIETNEALQPALYLWRRLVPNSGGPGIHRGGQGLEIAFSIHDSEGLDGAMTLLVSEAPSQGTGGGHAGGTGSWAPTHGTNVVESLAAGEQLDATTLTGRTPRVPSNLGRLVLSRGDVLRVAGNGGGGVGDPLLRDAAQVARDVADRYVTADNARDAYGVTLAGDGSVEVDATAELRAKIRRERIDADPEREQGGPETPGVAVVIGDEHDWRCAYCDSDLGPADEDWRERATRRHGEAVARFAAVDMYVKPREGESTFVVDEYFCPGCAGLLRSHVYPRGSAPVSMPKLARSS
ncbi:MAG: hydantoinase B/oxoprolinase family protein [Actinobacteria bacterium]|nr:hydantoinase B/oxoprolinase family protein [Actinomycetota bacterium]